jgi:hypothetical protein
MRVSYDADNNNNNSNKNKTAIVSGTTALTGTSRR